CPSAPRSSFSATACRRRPTRASRGRSRTRSSAGSRRGRSAPGGPCSMADRLDLVEALQLDRGAALSERIRDLVLPRGDERALDVGSGLGALALALAPHVREVVAVEIDPERVERARRLPVAGDVTFVVGDARELDLDDASFDFAGTLRTLHHVDR